MKKTIIGLVGFANSGKDTVGKMLVQHYGFQKDSFAAPLKDSVSAIFGYDRSMLEGDGDIDRQWRETVEPWWAEKMKNPAWTPRLAMQIFGTEIMRNHFSDTIWIDSLEHRLEHTKRERIVITDARFRNEIGLIHKMGGYVIHVKGSKEPWWFNDMARYNSGDKTVEPKIKEVLTSVHQSERDWVGTKVDYVVDNTIKSLDVLKVNVDKVMQNVLQ